MNWTKDLFDAVSEADAARVKDSLTKGANILAIVDERDILSAALAGTTSTDKQILNLLIESGANPNLCSSDGTTALYWAASCNDSTLVTNLIEVGARVNAERPEDGHTSLHASAEHGNRENVKLLLEAGGEVALNSFDYVAHTPLMWAVEIGNIEIAKALIDAGSDLNAHDGSQIGDTALLIATEAKNAEMVQLLINGGADPSIPGWMGITALSVVEKPNTPVEKRIHELLAQQ